VLYASDNSNWFSPASAPPIGGAYVQRFESHPSGGIKVDTMTFNPNAIGADGVASLMLSVDPSLTPAQVLARMQMSVRAFPTGTIRDCTTTLCGAGIADAAAAVLAALRAATTTTLASSANRASGAGVHGDCQRR
jgi:hypothetical protein